MKQKNELKTVWLLLCLFFAVRAHSQHTGSYDTVMSFGTGSRAVSLYVPVSYSPGTPHRLIVGLHGLGDTCNSYRNALVSSLGWSSHFPNTIIVCPEAANRNTDYYVPAGGEMVIQAAIDFIKAVYNIDTERIVLQGFSLGGRAALRYGLDHRSVFQGVILNTPAIQGVKEALNEGGYTFNYAHASGIPIYITHGEDDIFYTGPIDSMYRKLVQNDASVRLNRIPGLAHTIPAFAAMSDVTNWLATPAHTGADVDLVAVSVPRRTCGTTVVPRVLLRNVGNMTIHSADLLYMVGSATGTMSWTGTLFPYQHAWVTLPTVSVAAGDYTCSVSVSSLNGGIVDTFVSNNTASAPFFVVTSGTLLPLNEGFEGTAFAPSGWVRRTSGDIYCAWDRDNTVRKAGVASMTSFNSILMFDNTGRVDEMESPVLNFGTVSLPQLSFDVAFNYHRYTPPLLLLDTTFADTLSVLVSTDCGENYTTVYKKGGSDLATFPAPILNATSVSAAFINPTSSNWRNDVIDLSAFAGADEVIVKLSYKSALGGSINIDNVSLSDAAVSIKENTIDRIKIFPNPTTNTLQIVYENSSITNLLLVDNLGRALINRTYSDPIFSVTEDISSLPAGIYFVRISCDKGQYLEKIEKLP